MGEDELPLIEELYYTETVANNSNVLFNNKKRWLQQVYGDLLSKSEAKMQLLKLIEYNKIMIIENYQFLAQNTEIEVVMCKLMKQRLINDNLKFQLKVY